MYGNFASGSSSVTRTLRRIGCTIGILLYLAFIAAPCLAQQADPTSLPKVLMLDIHGVTPNDPVLYDAIRAQLSAAPLILDRAEIAHDTAFSADPLGSASKSAEENDAAMVFWIEDSETCRLFFFIPAPDGGRINSRTLDLSLNSSWSRFQIIAIAAASMVEGLLVSHHIQPLPPERKKANDIPPGGEAHQKDDNRKWFEISAAYAGSFFAPEMVTHGVYLSLGLRPTRHFVMAVAFTQNVRTTLKTEEYRINMLSRGIEVSTAGRIRMHSAEIRLGVAWSMDLRSYSTTFSSESIDPAPDGLNSVHTLLPFVAAEWRFSERIGIFGRVGAGFALNETDYKISRIDGATTELAPFLVKLSYQLGLILQI